MKVTVIPTDRWIRRDDDAANLTDWPFDDAHIHAIQWYGEEGEIEDTGRPKPSNEAITDAAILQPYLDALDAYFAAQVEAAASVNEPLQQ